jgi:hypothetical protein
MQLMWINWVKNVITMNKHTQSELENRREVALEIYSKETNCIFMSHARIEDKSFENMWKFKYLGMNVRN